MTTNRERAEKAAIALRPAIFLVCAALHSDTGANDPQDCDWPFCGCDPHADKVIEAIQESGFSLVRDEDLLKMTKAGERVGAAAVPTKPSISLDKLGSVKQGLDEDGAEEWIRIVTQKINDLERQNFGGANLPPTSIWHILQQVCAAPPSLPVQDDAGREQYLLGQRELLHQMLTNPNLILDDGFRRSLRELGWVPVAEIAAPAVQDERADPPSREPHDGWLNAWLYKNMEGKPCVHMWSVEVRKMAGDWADFRASRSASADASEKK